MIRIPLPVRRAATAAADWGEAAAPAARLLWLVAAPALSRRSHKLMRVPWHVVNSSCRSVGETRLQMSRAGAIP